MMSPKTCEWIEKLKPASAPLPLVGGPAAIAILPGKNQLDRGTDAMVGQCRKTRSFQQQGGA
jgi:hypothetical protein